VGYDMYRRGEDRKSEADYFRLNIWGMDEAREQLYRVGIVRGADAPPVPRPEDFGLDADNDGIDLADDHPYMVACRHWQEGFHGEAPGIPSYKLGSNDGWVVQPLEVQSGVRYADEHHPGWRDGLADFVAEWVTWMEASPEGFEVW
jgi:hypothetical protein